MSYHGNMLSIRVNGLIEDRLKSAEEVFNNKGRLDEVTATLTTTMQQSQDALRSLHRPVGPSLEDAQVMMAAVQVWSSCQSHDKGSDVRSSGVH